MRLPIDGYPIAAGFLQSEGQHFTPERPHLGIDFACPEGTPVYAPYPGTVYALVRLDDWGNCVVLKHSNGRYTAYAHLSAFAEIEEGQLVAEGDLLGYSGATGGASHPHLHWEGNHDPSLPRGIQHVWDPRSYREESAS